MYSKTANLEPIHFRDVRITAVRTGVQGARELRNSTPTPTAPTSNYLILLVSILHTSTIVL